MALFATSALHASLAPPPLLTPCSRSNYFYFTLLTTRAFQYFLSVLSVFFFGTLHSWRSLALPDSPSLARSDGSLGYSWIFFFFFFRFSFCSFSFADNKKISVYFVGKMIIYRYRRRNKSTNGGGPLCIYIYIYIISELSVCMRVHCNNNSTHLTAAAATTKRHTAATYTFTKKRKNNIHIVRRAIPCFEFCWQLKMRFDCPTREHCTIISRLFDWI